jgi:hypothetical protein
VTCHGPFVAQDNQLHAGSCDGYVHTAEVAQETNLSFVVAANHRDDDDVALLSLEAIDGVDADEASEGFEILTLHEQSA